jgi:hypothetical protein
LAWGIVRSCCSDKEIANWVRTHLVPRVPPETQARIQVADQMFVTHLDRQFQDTRFDPHLGFLFRDSNGQRYVVPERQIGLLCEWYTNHQTMRGLMIAGEVLRHIGKRCDLDLLDQYEIPGDSVEVERVKAGIRFSVRRRTLT